MSKTTSTPQKASRMRRSHPLSATFNRYSFRLLGRGFPKLMSWWALRLWSQTHRFEPPAREQRLQLRASECSLIVSGLEIKAWSWGSGPSVLLVHGWNGRGMQLGRFVDPLLTAGYQVITFDAPGHGQSEGKHTHLLQIRDVILALAKQHGDFHAAIAHSFGVAALSAAMKNGLHITNAVAISSPGGLSNLIGRYCASMRIPDATEQYLRQRLRLRLGATLWEQFAHSYPLDTGMERSLIIHDKDDEWVDWQESEQLSQCWPNAELVITEGLGHQRLLRDPKIARQIIQFIGDYPIFDPHDD